MLAVLENGEPIEINDVITIGRGSDNDVLIMWNGVSRQHCKLYKEDNKFFVEDLNSTNGTYINGHKIEGKKEVFPNDIINIAAVSSIYLYS